jgi:hypothetical protein
MIAMARGLGLALLIARADAVNPHHALGKAVRVTISSDTVSSLIPKPPPCILFVHRIADKAGLRLAAWRS